MKAGGSGLESADVWGDQDDVSICLHIKNYQFKSKIPNLRLN
jgi:hypothetical protein